jgi:hypothetical protein
MKNFMEATTGRRDRAEVEAKAWTTQRYSGPKLFHPYTCCKLGSHLLPAWWRRD